MSVQKSVYRLCFEFLVGRVHSIFQSHLATSPMSSARPTVEAWLTTILLPEQVTHTLSSVAHHTSTRRTTFLHSSSSCKDHRLIYPSAALHSSSNACTSAALRPLHVGRNCKEIHPDNHPTRICCSSVDVHGPPQVTRQELQDLV
jgi:hypothetical protein